MPGTFSPPPRISDPDMHHGTCVTHVPWCMLGSLTSGFLWNLWWGKRSRIPGACATHNFTYLVRGPCGIILIMVLFHWLCSSSDHIENKNYETKGFLSGSIRDKIILLDENKSCVQYHIHFDIYGKKPFLLFYSIKFVPTCQELMFCYPPFQYCAHVTIVMLAAGLTGANGNFSVRIWVDWTVGLQSWYCTGNYPHVVAMAAMNVAMSLVLLLTLLLLFISFCINAYLLSKVSKTDGGVVILQQQGIVIQPPPPNPGPMWMSTGKVFPVALAQLKLSTNKCLLYALVT